MSVIHLPDRPRLDLRQLILPITIGVGLLVLLGRLWYLQVVVAEELVERANQVRISSTPSHAPRGLIYLRDGTLLAGVRQEIVITAVPSTVRKEPWVLEKLARMLGVSVERLQNKVDSAAWRPHLPAPIYVGASIDVATRIAEAGDDLPGIGVESQPMRFYSDPVTYGHLLGYVWVPGEEDVQRLKDKGLDPPDYVGKMGLEYTYEELLMGRKGGRFYQIDALRRPLRLTRMDNSTPGDRLTLSIDPELQKYATERLKGFTGAIVAIEPETGEVLCMVSLPTYDSSLFLTGISVADYRKLADDPTFPLINRAIAASHAPGSTFKLVVAIAAARRGVLNPNTTVNCPGYYEVGNRRVKCLGRHGPIAFERAMAKSCNTYFADLGMRVGHESIKESALLLGLGERLGIDLRGERRGVVPTDEWIARWRNPPKWYPGDTVNLSLGQGELSATPLQMARLTAILANGGVGFEPTVVHRIQDPSDELRDVPRERAPNVELGIAPSQLELILRSMRLTVIDGTAKAGQIPGITWAAKTGSAEFRRDRKTHSWCVGFAPANGKAKIAIAVMAEGAGHGGEIAVPITRDVLRFYLDKSFARSDRAEDIVDIAVEAVPVSPDSRSNSAALIPSSSAASASRGVTPP